MSKGTILVCLVLGADSDLSAAYTLVDLVGTGGTWGVLRRILGCRTIFYCVKVGTASTLGLLGLILQKPCGFPTVNALGPAKLLGL